MVAFLLSFLIKENKQYHIQYHSKKIISYSISKTTWHHNRLFKLMNLSVYLIICY